MEFQVKTVKLVYQEALRQEGSGALKAFHVRRIMKRLGHSY
jgi:hypothetical protein